MSESEETVANPGHATRTVEGCPFCDTTQIASPIEHWRALAPSPGPEPRVVQVMTFEPRDPVTPGHLLVVPAAHVDDATEDTAITAACALVAAEVVAQRHGAANILTSVGAAATQTVRHLHLHVVPREDDDGLALPWTGQVTGQPPTRR